MSSETQHTSEYNFTELYRLAFGNIGMPYTGLHKPLPKSSGTFPLETGEVKTGAVQSLLGTPIFMPCYLDGYRLPNEPLVEVNGSKEIIRTPVGGGKTKYRGTVKELYMQNDWDITIRGIIVSSEEDEYPEAEVRKFRELYEEGRSLPIENIICSLFNISLVAIRSIKMPAVEGNVAIQPYVITGYSDEEFELELKEKTA